MFEYFSERTIIGGLGRTKQRSHNLRYDRLDPDEDYKTVACKGIKIDEGERENVSVRTLNSILSMWYSTTGNTSHDKEPFLPF